MRPGFKAAAKMGASTIDLLKGEFQEQSQVCQNEGLEKTGRS